MSAWMFIPLCSAIIFVLKRGTAFPECPGDGVGGGVAAPVRPACSDAAAVTAAATGAAGGDGA